MIEIITRPKTASRRSSRHSKIADHIHYLVPHLTSQQAAENLPDAGLAPETFQLQAT